ncbi:hypothetical protein RPC_4710 [Rhodopseudomonas palustris BisB18]|uniref:Uncharacterized protein n=1 Tax=Rhodopseudomonas palustris (strain BisB18) TaxID=316056 RepID=Q20XA4_RHOPB
MRVEASNAHSPDEFRHLSSSLRGALRDEAILMRQVMALDYFVCGRRCAPSSARNDAADVSQCQVFARAKGQLHRDIDQIRALRRIRGLRAGRLRGGDGVLVGLDGGRGGLGCLVGGELGPRLRQRLGRG